MPKKEMGRKKSSRWAVFSHEVPQADLEGVQHGPAHVEVAVICAIVRVRPFILVDEV